MVCASASCRIIDFLKVQTFFLFIIKDLNRPLMQTLSGEANRVRPKLRGAIICLTKRVLTLDNNVRIAWIPWIARKILLQRGWQTFDFFQKGLWQSKVYQIFEHLALALFLVNILHALVELNFDFLKCLLWQFFDVFIGHNVSVLMQLLQVCLQAVSSSLFFFETLKHFCDFCLCIM